MKTFNFHFFITKMMHIFTKLTSEWGELELQNISHNFVNTYEYTNEILK